jgi:hypothetical protein
VASPGSVRVETLANRLKEEALGLGATLVAPPLVGAWARKPQ